MKLSKTVLVVLVVLCFVVVVSGCTSTNTQSSSSNSSSNNSSASASDEVNVVISYSGSWAVDVSGPFGYRSFSGSGDQTNNIGSVNGAVTAAARKTDGGTSTLQVLITKGGKTVSSASTNAPYGGASAVFTG